MPTPRRSAPYRAARLALLASLLVSVAIGTGCRKPEVEPQSIRFALGARDVEVVFRGEFDDADLFGADTSLLGRVHPLTEEGTRQGVQHQARPGWLRFEYRIDGERREVLVAKQPLLNMVSWNDIARAGAALGDDAAVWVDGQRVPQGARVKDREGNEYRVRLPDCGQATRADLSEWNLLIGAVHRGDMDFKGEHYGWIRSPYDDKDLKVGYHGSLSWCRDERTGERVARGYFFVSRFFAAPPEMRTSRLHWRPILERIPATDSWSQALAAADPALEIVWSPSLRVGYAGRVSNAELFGSAGGVDRQLRVEAGLRVDKEPPDWMRFLYRGKTVLVAAQPLRYALSWDEIARAGAALGDGSAVKVGSQFYRQDATVTDVRGVKYRVRLMECGRATQDIASEWNALIGGVHEGDGDFLAYPRGIYGWLKPPFTDMDLALGGAAGFGASWCRETLEIEGTRYAVNRGYFTVSRFHATPTDFDGDGFAWRPVLEVLP